MQEIIINKNAKNARIILPAPNEDSNRIDINFIDMDGEYRYFGAYIVCSGYGTSTEQTIVDKIPDYSIDGKKYIPSIEADITFSNQSYRLTIYKVHHQYKIYVENGDDLDMEKKLSGDVIS